jgi:hypothetical protein
MVPSPDLVSPQNVIDVVKVVTEVIPRNTNFLRPLLYTYLWHTLLCVVISFLSFFTQKIRQYITHISYTNPLGNPRRVLTCRTFVLSYRSSGLFLEDQLEQLDSSGLHACLSSWMKYWLCFERLAIFRSFRSLWVCCKSSFYLDLELSYEHLVTVWNRRYTILSYQCTIHWYY